MAYNQSYDNCLPVGTNNSYGYPGSATMSRDESRDSGYSDGSYNYYENQGLYLSNMVAQDDYVYDGGYDGGYDGSYDGAYDDSHDGAYDSHDYGGYDAVKNEPADGGDLAGDYKTGWGGRSHEYASKNQKSHRKLHGKNDPQSYGADQGPEVQHEASPESAAYATSSTTLQCLQPGCNAKPFRRQADLQRHYLHKHTPSAQKEPLYCDYRKCSRAKLPFYRRDHFRDHYREFHQEDVPKRATSTTTGMTSSGESREWYESRAVKDTWWRCPKCIHRVYVEADGWRCGKCRGECDIERRLIRGWADPSGENEPLPESYDVDGSFLSAT